MTTEPKNLLMPAHRDELRAWFEKHHRVEKTCWIVVLHGRPKTQQVWYIDAVEEALCFGWIDGILKRLDCGVTAHQFFPRRKKSHWTELNKERCRRLERLGRMTDAGRAVLPDMSPGGFRIDPTILNALQADALVWEKFQSFPPLYQRIRIDNIQSRKHRPELFQKYLQRFIQMTKLGKLYGNWNDFGRLGDWADADRLSTEQKIDVTTA